MHAVFQGWLVECTLLARGREAADMIGKKGSAGEESKAGRASTAGSSNAKQTKVPGLSSVAEG